MSSDEPPGADDLLTPPAPPRPENAIASPAPRKRRLLPFRRCTHDRYLAGIAGGEGRRLGLDPFFLRVALVGVTLILARNGSGAFVVPLIAYLAAWLLWPTDDEPSLLRRLGQRPAQQEASGAIAAVLFATLVIGRPSLVWAGILLGAAVALLSKRPEAVRAPDQATHVPFEAPSSPATTTPEQQAIIWGRSLRGAIGPRPVVRPPPTPRPPRRTPPLWPLTASLLFAYGFGCVLLDNLLDPGVDPGVAVNGAIAIIGGVILLSGWRGRAMLTSLLLVPLAPAWVAFSVADTPRFADTNAGASERYADGQIIEQSKGYGGLTVYLAADDLPESGGITAKVGITAGQVDVWVPKEADLRIIGHVGLGVIEVYEEPYFSAYDGDGLVDYGLDRSYSALGRTCYETLDSEDGFRNAALWSGVDLAGDATGEEVAEVVEKAGYPRPVSRISTAYGPYDDHTGELVYDENGQEVTGEYQRTDWSYQTNENGGLCLPVPPPANPVLITIDATIGLGNLKVHRV